MRNMNRFFLKVAVPMIMPLKQFEKMLLRYRQVSRVDKWGQMLVMSVQGAAKWRQKRVIHERFSLI